MMPEPSLPSARYLQFQHYRSILFDLKTAYSPGIILLLFSCKRQTTTPLPFTLRCNGVFYVNAAKNFMRLPEQY
jgi:hypothetical protein